MLGSINLFHTLTPTLNEIHMILQSEIKHILHQRHPKYRLLSPHHLVCIVSVHYWYHSTTVGCYGRLALCVSGPSTVFLEPLGRETLS